MEELEKIKELLKQSLGIIMAHVELNCIRDKKFEAVTNHKYDEASNLRALELAVMKELPRYSDMKLIYDQL